MKHRKSSKQNPTSHNKGVRKQNTTSPDGKWEKMKTRGLLRYKPSGVFFGRTRYKGALLFRTLDTTDHKTAIDRLPVYKKVWKKEFDDNQAQTVQTNVAPTTWREAAAIYNITLENRAKIGDMKFKTAKADQVCIKKIAFYWPSIEDRPVRDIDPTEFMTFFADASAGEGPFTAEESGKKRDKRKGEFPGGKQGAIAYNHMLNTAGEIVKIAKKRDHKKGLPGFDDPLEDVPHVSWQRNEPVMPTDEEWAKILDAIELVGQTDSYRKPRRLFAEFIGMTGARLIEVIGPKRHHHPKDEPHPGFRFKDMVEGKNIITSAKKRGTKKWKKREVPWIDGAKELMKEIRDTLYKGDDNALVFEIMPHGGIDFALRIAIRKCGLEHKLKGFSQHRIRHLFGTKCAEAGCSWKSIADMLGHEDGGILAAKLYSHARKEAVAQQASQVSYRKKALAAAPSAGGSATVSPAKSISINGQEFTYEEICEMATKYQASAKGTKTIA